MSAPALQPRPAALRSPQRAGVELKANGEVSRIRSHKGNAPTLPQTKFCTLCPAKFTRTTHLNRHLRSHTGERGFRCGQCSAEFTRSDLLTRHKRTCGDSLNSNKSRRKSCQSCAESKVKCNLQQPCSKCVARGRDCVYLNDPEVSRSKKLKSGSSSLSGSSGAKPAHGDVDGEGELVSPVTGGAPSSSDSSRSSFSQPSPPSPSQDYSRPPYDEPPYAPRMYPDAPTLYDPYIVQPHAQGPGIPSPSTYAPEPSVPWHANPMDTYTSGPSNPYRDTYSANSYPSRGSPYTYDEGIAYGSVAMGSMGMDYRRGSPFSALPGQPPPPPGPSQHAHQHPQHPHSYPVSTTNGLGMPSYSIPSPSDPHSHSHSHSHGHHAPPPQGYQGRPYPGDYRIHRF